MYAFTRMDDRCAHGSNNGFFSSRHRRTGLTLLQLALFLLAVPVSAQMVFHSRPSSFYFPDSAETRAAYADVISAPLREVVEGESVVHRQSSNVHRVEYRVIAEPEAVYQLFVPEQNGGYPVAAAGSYIIKRDRRSGRFEQVKIFLAADPGFFVRIFPDDGISRMDVFIAGERLRASVRLPLSFDRVLVEPFDMAARVTRHIVDWSLLAYSRDAYADARITRLVEGFLDRQDLPDEFTPPHELDTAVSVDRLASMLYQVHQETPGAVVTGSIHPTEYRDSPPETGEIFLFPHIDAGGIFRADGFTDSRRISLQSLKAQYQESFFFGAVHLPDALADSREDVITPLN